MSRRKKSKAVPVVLIIVILCALLGGGCLAANYFGQKGVIDSWTDVVNKYNASVEDINRQNQEIQAEYDALLLEMKNQAQTPANPSWPDHKSEGWDIIDLSNFALENQTAETKTRADLMNNGMLLINEWHSRPEDFDETAIVSVGRYLGGNNKVQVNDYKVSLFPVAADALLEAVNAGKELGYKYYIVEEGYRTYEEQNTMFQNKLTKLSGKYTGDALYAAAKKEVNAPGTSEFNSGLSFTLRLYEKGNDERSKPKYSTTEDGKWMNENCWKYGLIFRFPQANWPLDSTMDKSFKTGVSMKMNLYRYVGKGNAAVMHILDLCMEEYIEYLQEHQHIAVFEDGVLKYEIYRQYVGDAQTFDIQLTGNARSHVSSLDNMGAVITVFEFQ